MLVSPRQRPRTHKNAALKHDDISSASNISLALRCNHLCKQNMMDCDRPWGSESLHLKVWGYSALLALRSWVVSCCSMWKRLSVSGSCLFMTVKWSTTWTGRLMWHQDYVGCTRTLCWRENWAGRKLLIYPLSLTSSHKLWWVTEKKIKNLMADTSGLNEFLPKGLWAQP